jgi:LPS export ABC transporter protein LptC
MANQAIKILFSVAIFTLLITLLTACGNEIPEIKKFEKKTDEGVEHAEGVEMLYSDSAIVRIKVTAAVMNHIMNPEKPLRIFPKGLLVDFFNSNKEQVSKLTSKYAERDENSGLVQLRDSVVVWNKKDERLESDELWWSEPQQRIYSTKAVKITTPTQVIHGRGFESNGDFTHWTIKEVTGIVQAKTLFQNGF